MGSSILEFLFEITAAGDIDVYDASAHAAFNLYVFYCWSHVYWQDNEIAKKMCYIQLCLDNINTLFIFFFFFFYSQTKFIRKL